LAANGTGTSGRDGKRSTKPSTFEVERVLAVTRLINSRVRMSRSRSLLAMPSAPPIEDEMRCIGSAVAMSEVSRRTSKRNF
jgi:hypothetical protein